MMAKPKRFTPEQFEVRLNHAIERLIADKQRLIAEQRSDIRIEDIADIFNVDTSTLRRWCVEFVQKNPSQYLAEYRIKKAKYLFRQGVKPSKVFEILAFTEHKIFSITFKRYQGITPSDYVKSKN